MGMYSGLVESDQWSVVAG